MFCPKCVPKMKAHGLHLTWRQCLGHSGWSKVQSWFQHIPAKCCANILRSGLFRAALQRFCKTSTSLAVLLDSEIACGTIQSHPMVSKVNQEKLSQQKLKDTESIKLHRSCIGCLGPNSSQHVLRLTHLFSTLHLQLLQSTLFRGHLPMLFSFAAMPSLFT